MTTLQIPEPIRGFIAAINENDTDAFINAFSATAFVDDWGTKYTGREEITAWSDRELLGAGGKFTAERVTRDSDSITVVGDWRSSFANGPSLFRFELLGDKIASMTIREG